MEIQLWREILLPYKQAVEELEIKFKSIIYENRQLGKHSLIEDVNGRVKKISSILDKANKKNIPMNEIEEKIDDIAGIRLICQFVEDIDAVVELIRNRKDMEVKYEKNYIDNTKKSGYRSYHIIVYYYVHTALGEKRIQAEIQIRTLAMNFWATIEHSLQYKYKHNIPIHIKDRLINASKAVVQMDHEMSLIRSEILDAQSTFQYKSSIVADILNNIQNLYKLADKSEVEQVQAQFYNVWKDGDINELVTFNKQLDTIAEGYRAQSLS